jgi:hypothetical protein
MRLRYADPLSEGLSAETGSMLAALLRVLSFLITRAKRQIAVYGFSLAQSGHPYNPS